MNHKELFEKYDELINKWEDETAMLSSVSQMIEYDSYKELESLGPEIVPFIISDFYHGDYHHLTHLIDKFSVEEVVIPDRDFGRISRIANFYVWWGLDKDILNLTKEERIAYNIETDDGKLLLRQAILAPYEHLTGSKLF